MPLGGLPPTRTLFCSTLFLCDPFLTVEPLSRLKLNVRENPVFHFDLNLHEVPAHRVSAIPLGRPLLVIGARFIITGIKAAFR